MRKNILILTSCWGGGHNAAAIGVQDHLKNKHNTEIIDFIEFCNSFINQAIKKGYIASIKFAPKLYTKFFDSTDKEWQSKLVNILSYPLIKKKFQDLVYKHNPDIIISTFPLWNYSIRRIWNKLNSNPKLITVITDSTTIHNSWILNDHSDIYIVTDRITKEIINKKGIKKEKIFDFGFPLKKVFFNSYDKESVLEGLGLSKDRFTILFYLNNNTTKRNYDILKELSKTETDTQSIIVTGKDRSFEKKIKNLQFLSKTKILGWTDITHKLMQGTDIIITKAGGASISECIQSGIPILITDVLPQEEGNAKYVINKGMGVRIPKKTPKEISEYILDIKDTDTYKNLVKNALNLKFSNNTPKIVELINKNT